VTEAEPESDTTQEGEDGDDGVIPDKKGVLGKRGECLSNGSSKGAHEQIDRHDHGLHVGRSLGVGVLERGDICEDFGNTDEDIRQHLGPDVDVGLAKFFDAVGVTSVLSAG